MTIPDAFIPGTGRCLPGTQTIEEMVTLAENNDFAKDMVLRELIRCWHLADNQTDRYPYKAPLREAILILHPEWE